MGRPTTALFSDVIEGHRKATDGIEVAPESLKLWYARYGDDIIGCLIAEHDGRLRAEGRLKGEVPMPAEMCGARAAGGPCTLPAGHNRGQADIPTNHRTGPAHVASRALAIGRELLEIDSAMKHLDTEMGNRLLDADAGSKWDVMLQHRTYVSLSERRQALRTELYEMGMS